MYDVIIIGGGLSGITAGHTLLKSGIENFVILEAKSRVGGRSYAEKLKTANGEATLDLGGQWVGKTQPHVLQMARDLGIEVYPQYEEGWSFARLRDGKIRRFKGTIPSVNPLALIELHFLLRYVNGQAATVNVDDPSKTPNAAELDSITLHSAVVKKAWSSACQELFDIAVRIIFGCETRDMSLLYFLWYTKSAGSIEQLIETKNGGQEFKLVGGAYQLCTKQADIIGPDRIRFNSPVIAISHDDDVVRVTLSSGEEVRGRYVVVATPPHLSASFQYSPPLPIKKLRLLQHSLPGCAIKVLITYPTPFWREQGFSGSAVDTASLISCIYDGCTPAGDAALIIFIVGRAAMDYNEKPAEERKQAVLGAVRDFLGEPGLSPISYLEQNWTMEPFNGGCPVPHIPPGILSVCGSYLRNPIGRIHWAGTETATCWSGFLNGAIQAGERAAGEIVSRIRSEQTTVSTAAVAVEVTVEPQSTSTEATSTAQSTA